MLFDADGPGLSEGIGDFKLVVAGRFEVRRREFAGSGREHSKLPFPERIDPDISLSGNEVISCNSNSPLLLFVCRYVEWVNTIQNRYFLERKSDGVGEGYCTG